MKKLFRLFLVCVLLLTSCVSINKDIPPQYSVSDVSATTHEEESGVFPLSRKDIIEADLTVPSGDTQGVASWAEEWIRQCYNDNELYAVKAEPVYPPSRVSSINILDGMKAGCDAYKVSFKVGIDSPYMYAESDGNSTREVDVFWVDDGQMLYLSNIQWSGNQWTYYYDSYKKLYNEVNKDIRFTYNLNPELHTTMDKGVTLFNVHDIDAKLRTPILISDQIAVSIAFLNQGEDGIYKFDLYIYNYINNKILLKKSFDNEKAFPNVSVKDGNIILSFNYREGDFDVNLPGILDPKDDPMVLLEKTMNQNGQIINQTISSAYEKRYYLDGGACILWKENSLYLLDERTGSERLLIKGVFSSEKDVEGCHFVTSLDANRFIYYISGYEWIIKSGVYDISTFIDYPFSYEESTYGILPLAYSSGKVYASNHPTDGTMPANDILVGNLNEGYELIAPYQNTPELKDKNIIQSIMVSDDGKNICAVAENGFGVTVLLYIKNGLIKSWNIETSVSTKPYHLLAFTHKKIVLFGNEMANGNLLFYEISY